MKKGRILKTRDILLKPITKQDIEFLRQLRNKPANRKKFFCRQYIDKRKQKKWYQQYLKLKNDLMFGIYNLNQKRIGCLGLSNIDLEKKKAEIGRLIIKDKYRRKGYAKEAILLVKKYAFEELKLKQLFLRLFEKNKPALNLYKKLGFREVKNKERGKIFMVYKIKSK